MAEKQKKAVFGSLQPDVDPLLELNDLTAADFAPATSGEKEDFIQQRKSVSYWADAWRRLRKNVVAMVALGVIVLLVLFAFVGPMLVPYGYDQFNAGAENLYPWHYSLEAQQAYKEATSSQDPDEAVAAAEAEAAARGEELSSKDKALIRAQAKAGGGAEYEGMSEEEIYKALGYSAQPFGYSNDELQRIADGEKVFPHVFGTDRYGRDIMVRTMFATRVSMIIGLTAALIVLVIGALYGSISGFFGGTVDVVMQRIVDVIYSLPDVLIILLIATAMGPHVTQFITDHQGFFLAEFFKKVGPNLMGMFIAFACLYWVGMSRIIRGQILYKALGYSAQPFGYSNDELQRIADGEKVFPHVFGTDRYGRDIMVRTMFATRVSMIIGLTAALIVLVIGALYGSISGFFGGTVDVVMQRIVDVIYSLPDVLIILLIATAMGPHVTQFITDHQGFFLAEFFKKVGPNLMGMFIAFACLYWVGMSRIIRGQILTLKKQEYVTAARALGASSGRIIKRHLLPNCIGQIVATTCLQIPSAIFTESFMSFLGVGVLAPLTSLGSMCSDALGGISTYPYRLIIPAIIISIMILSFNLFGDGLRDALDPRLKK